jgi:hypothetical protein
MRGIPLAVVAVLAAGCVAHGGYDRVLQPGSAELHERAPEVFASLQRESGPSQSSRATTRSAALMRGGPRDVPNSRTRAQRRIWQTRA